MAKADNMYFTGSTSGIAGPNGVLYGPYGMTVNGSPIDAFCISDGDTITAGETWQATAYNAASLGAQYQQAAYVLSQFYNAGASNAAVSDALWAIFDPSYTYNDPAATSLLAAATNSATLAAFVNSGQLADYTFYLYSAGTSSGGSAAQDMIAYTPGGATPEPSSLLLLGSGLAGAALYLRRRLSA
ncbi:MAG: PEP-CTERM sorting domain-containing protein [Acidobacteriaceae bacterium]|nr:PEP-CTERM sorting domain-containing protein [Acidobacteriaceae bacterium]